MMIYAFGGAFLRLGLRVYVGVTVCFVRTGVTAVSVEVIIFLLGSA